MPLFEYLCRSCQKDFEQLELAGRRVEHACPHCGSTELTKKISVFSARSARSAGGGTPCGGGACENGPCGNGMGCD